LFLLNFFDASKEVGLSLVPNCWARIVLLVCALTQLGCERDAAPQSRSASAQSQSTTSTAALPAPVTNSDNDALELDWMQLMPAHEQSALREQMMSGVNHGLGPDTFADPSELKARQMQQAGAVKLGGTVPQYHGKRVRVAGYAVPVEFTETQATRELLFVHVPPPPENQIIFAVLAEPKLDVSMFEAYWLEGTLYAERFENDMAASAYSMRDASLVLWEE
jgi:uncharacterized protein